MSTGFVPIFAAYVVFRFWYFDDWVPNTARAKEGPSLSSLVAPGKLGALLEAAGGDVGWLLLAGAGVVVWMLSRQKQLELRSLILLAYTGTAAGIYLLLPNDWMGEFRFATPFFVLAILDPGRHRLRRACVASPFSLAADVRRRRQCAGSRSSPGSLYRANGNVCQLSGRAARDVRLTAQGFNQLSERIGGGSHSLLTPDLGG